MPLRPDKPKLFLATVFIMMASLFLISLPVYTASSNAYQDSALLTSTGIPQTHDLNKNSTSNWSGTYEETVTYSVSITDTQTTTPTITETATPTPSPSPTVTPSPESTQFSYMPNLLREFFIPTSTPFPTPDTVLFCDSLGSPLFIPDNNPAGVNNDIYISDDRSIANLRLYLDISHSYVGDLVVTLTNLTSGKRVTVLDRPGDDPDKCANSGIVSILDDSAIQKADDQCAYSPHAISGIFIPTEPLQQFYALNASGTWRLNVSDRYINDVGYLNHWCLDTRLTDRLPAPTPSPTPVDLPSHAFVFGMSGQDQQLKLDCESRAAVDWAAHYGKSIGELEFQYNLPTSDDPEVGFVGNPSGIWGKIPPNDYGVHAPPIASLLNKYGLEASPFKSLSWDDLRSEIASGDPVIVWIIGDNAKNIVYGTPHYYTAVSTGKTTVVAPYEHSVILIGYTSSYVTLLNGSKFMDVSLDRFLDSWSVLDFMAVLAR